jgi:hypothetical protein
MGWDIVFHAQLAEREDPAARFRRVWEALDRREGFEPLSSFSVLADGDPSRRRVELSDVFAGAERVTPERVESLLREHDGPRVALQGTWRTRRGSARGAVTVTAFGREVARPDLPLRPVDLAWDVGDWRRYSPGGRDGWPSVDAVVADAATLVELGAESVWGVDGDKRLAPEHLYAVFHRDPERYRDDGGPPFPPVVITEECVRAALEVGDDRSAVETRAGPLVYHRELGGGRLVGFYAALQGAVEFLAGERA